MPAATVAENGEILFSVVGVELWRGERHLLRDVSLEVRAGELLQVSGPNGVGKTSLLRVMCGLLPAESGEVLWRGRSIRTEREEFCLQFAYLAHSNALKSDLTAAENLLYEVSLRRTISRAQCLEVLSQLGIVECADLAVRSLSAGQRRRVALARVILCAAKLWILDEPTTNLDADGVRLVDALLETHVANGGAVLVAAHHALLANHPHRRQFGLGV
jgi:heme exporter protein A